MSDHSLESEIMRTLAGNRRIRVDEIAVQANDGYVLVRGTVETVLERAEVVHTVRPVPGVQAVEDWLRLRLPTGKERLDAKAEAAVLRALIADDELHAADVDVHVRGDAVTLRGVVEHPCQREAAERIARGVGGVSCVRNQLRLLVQADADDEDERVTDAIGADAIAASLSSRSP